MKVPQIRYKVPDYYGDDEYHIENTRRILSYENVMSFTVSGSTFIPPVEFGNITKIQSNWLWRYGFTSISDTSTYTIYDENGTSHTSYYWYYYRYYGTSVGSNGNTPVTQLNLGINYSDRWYDVGEGKFITDAYQLNSSLVRSSISGSYMIRFADVSNIYIRSRPGYPSANDRAIIVHFKEDYVADLPSDMYSISDNIITWNVTHPIYRLLNGFEVFAVRSEE